MNESSPPSLEFRGRLRPEDGSKPALILVHGAGGAATLWLNQLRHFKPKRSTLALFLPGHGPEGGPGRESIAEYVEAIRAFLDETKLERVVLAGLSMGGAISQLFALTYPERLAGLVLASTGAKLKVLPLIFETIAKDFEGYLKLMAQFSFSKSAPEEVKQLVLEEAREQKPSVVLDDFRACDAFDVRERLSEIRVPTLVLSGEEDLLTPPKYSDYLVQHIPGAKLVRFEKAGHLLPVEKPEEFNAAIEKFLEELG